MYLVIVTVRLQAPLRENIFGCVHFLFNERQEWATIKIRLPEKKGKVKLKAMRAKGVKGLKQHGFQGRIQDFPKGGVETRDTKCGGGGGGGAVHFRPDTKSREWGGGRGVVLPAQARYNKRGWGVGCCPLQARYEKRGGGGGERCPLKARYEKRGGRGRVLSGASQKAGRGVATPKPPNPHPPPPPPPPPPPWIRLWFDVIAFKCLMRLMRFIRLGAREKICPGPGLALGGPEKFRGVRFSTFNLHLVLVQLACGLHFAWSEETNH